LVFVSLVENLHQIRLINHLDRVGVGFASTFRYWLSSVCWTRPYKYQCSNGSDIS